MISTEVMLALIAMFGTTMASVITAFVAVKTHKRTVETKNEMAAIHNSVNSKMDALLDATRKLARIEGIEEEREATARIRAEERGEE